MSVSGFLASLFDRLTFSIPAFPGGAEIARPENAAPYRKGGHRETCFSVRVDAHYKFMFAAGIII